MAKPVKKIGGDYFELQGTWGRKSDAQGLADVLRKRGKSARVVKTKEGYNVYKRRW